MFFYLECVTSLLLQGFFRLFVFCGITDFDFLLKGKYEAQSADTAAQLQRLQITGTPFILVDGQSVRGFDKSRLEKLLSSRPHGEKEGT